MRTNMADIYELHGYGRKNVQLCEEVTLMLNRWILVSEIESGSIAGN